MKDVLSEKYTVWVDDNFHFMDSSERYRKGEYKTPEAAVKVCKKIVDEYLKDEAGKHTTAEGLLTSYQMYGEDPYISGPEKVDFSAWDYAKVRADELKPAK